MMATGYSSIIGLYILILSVALYTNGAEVLIMPSSIFPVHRFTMRHLAEELVQRNHHVTWVEYGFKKPSIPLPKGVDEIYWQLSLPEQHWMDLYLYRNHSLHDRIWIADFMDEAQQVSAWMASIRLCDQAHYPGQLAEAFYLERNASINFVNTPPIFDFARPYMPRVNFVGALHCKKATPLKGDLARFVEGADKQNGVILFTTGFTAQWKRAPKKVVNAFVEAFTEKKDIRFVWQYDGEKIPNLPSNVFVADWLPQQDILGHPKTRAHITHGGLNSVIESVWHGVPVIGYPLTASGVDNLLRLTARNVGVMLKKRGLTKKTILRAIDEIYAQKYKDEMLIFQDMVTDVPYTELNHSAFWVEFIDRHQDVPHARSGADQLNVLQYFLVDVIMFLLSVLLILITIIYYALKGLLLLLVKFYRSRTAKEEAESKKTK
ncbi:unnamed protein product [Anisakis simplex]|uniref:glucuronosyltransferase n=1 Tax=Anisakis simplex TaxID=6269 RepID=A0A0M3K9G7_ANISI|nr:unnamed protein product [Anisakis simplex]